MMSHSPLRMFQEYHNKCVLLSGQGPVETIAKNIGFTNVVTIDQIRNAFPNLDMVDHARRPNQVCRLQRFVTNLFNNTFQKCLKYFNFNV